MIVAFIVKVATPLCLLLTAAKGIDFIDEKFHTPSQRAWRKTQASIVTFIRSFLVILTILTVIARAASQTSSVPVVTVVGLGGFCVLIACYSW